jgi:outer membrane protein assembly factor BamE (lipoprotein component of BamABCDE complex)
MGSDQLRAKFHRQQKIVKLLTNTSVAVLLATGVAGCSRDIEHRGYQPRAQDMQQLLMGMTKAEVRSVLGSPSTTATVQYQGDSITTSRRA